MRKSLAVLLALLVSACKVGPTYRPPQTPPPAAGAFQTAAPGTDAAAPRDDWWRLYDDPTLDALVRQALAANTDLRVARANLQRAQAALSEARADRLPQGLITHDRRCDEGQGAARFVERRKQLFRLQIHHPVA